MFDDFFSGVSDLGLKYIDNKFVSNNNDNNASQALYQAKLYEQMQQKAAPAPVKSPLDNKMLVYGGLGAIALLTLVIVVK